MIVVVAGTGRKVGKTSVTAGIIAALPEVDWTAIKISRHEHGEGWGITEEQEPSATDTGRYLAAGARRAYWIRAVETAMPQVAADVQRMAAGSAHTIVESNSIIAHLPAALVILVMDLSADAKTSAAEAERRADAIILPAGEDAARFGQTRCFVIQPPPYVTPALADFIRERLSG